ncbi:MAG TPA: hypothetical protein PLY56_17475 [Armatimonadota bacterium]|nr:hypothetical protein [Armatimonadota bacterium]
MLTPICPHGLTLRPLVLPGDSTVELRVENTADTEVVVTVDGQTGVPLAPEERVVVSQAPFRARLITPDTGDFFRKLREKLGWGERC